MKTRGADLDDALKAAALAKARAGQAPWIASILRDLADHFSHWQRQSGDMPLVLAAAAIEHAAALRLFADGIERGGIAVQRELIRHVTETGEDFAVALRSLARSAM